MTHLLAQIAPQRSTLYAALASQLAPQELHLSPLGAHITQLTPISIGRQDYLLLDIDINPAELDRPTLETLAMLSAFFEYFEQLGEVEGPLLRPLVAGFEPKMPLELVESRRYRGKTNELFTHFMLNVAKFSSRFADRPWPTLRLFDPLMGGGTTLFSGLVLGATVAGVDHNEQDVKTTVAFMREYARQERLRFQEEQARLKGLGERWVFSFGKKTQKAQQQATFAWGETQASAILTDGFKPHLLVTDLPYGVQHHGPLTALLSQAVPVWEKMLVSGGAMAFSWESTRFPREEMLAFMSDISQLAVLNTPPYDSLVHRVDRVIKARDVLVGVKA